MPDMPKRKHVDVDTEGDKDYGEPEGPGIRRKSTDVLRLACPFYVRYPDNFNLAKSCTGPGYDSISRLKEHLYRCHASARTISCPRCQTRFNDEKSMNSHLKETRMCTIVERERRDSVMEGISDDAMRLLRSRKGTKHHSSEARWYDIWNKLFPNYWTPESPYMKSPSLRSEVEIIRRFGDFIIEGLPYLFKEAVKYDHLTLTHSLQDTVHDNVSALVEQYLSKAQGSKPRREVFNQNRYANCLPSPARTLSTAESKYSTSESTMSESSPVFTPDSFTGTCSSPQLLDGQDVFVEPMNSRLGAESPRFLPFDLDFNAPRSTPLINWTGYLPELEGEFLYARTNSVLHYGGAVSDSGTITPMTTSCASPLNDVGGLQLKDSMF